MLTIGLIDYLNTMPFHYDLAERLHGADVQFERGVPSRMNSALMAGEIDLAPISAIEAARHADELYVLPDLCIASLGAVRTVLLFSWAADIGDLDAQSIALTDHSATSVALLRLLCRQRYAIAPQFSVTRQHLPSMLAAHAGALVIGDDALVEGALHRALSGAQGWGLPYIYDLGDEWLKMTGLPFVFALWAARRDRAEALQAAGVFDALYASTAAGLQPQARDGLATAYAARLGLPAGVCRRYLRDLRYFLGDDEKAGLKRFLQDAVDDFHWERLAFWQPEAAAML
ncbi:MAG: menaquinone biosynthesis protein [Chloroflexi bacterium]|nr:menaquinone biosynthesis protein [Chloroflexota bacterium]